MNDDGTIGGTLSYGATANGKTSDLGSMTLDGIYPNNVGKRLDLIDTVTGKSCFSEGYACADWVKETQTLVPDHQLDVNFKGTTKEYPNLKYKCSYDVPGKITEVPLGECIAYAPQFKPEAQKSGQTTGQPDGSTSTNTPRNPTIATVGQLRAKRHGRERGRMALLPHHLCRTSALHPG